jgi:hypothetical protein
MLKARTSLLDVRIASPCRASWQDMAGTERVRFCRECQRNVYNLSAMSRAEAEDLVRQRETQRLCIRFYRRADGTMLTADCPVGLRKMRWAARRSWAVLLGSLAAVIALFVAAMERRNTGGRIQRVAPLASLFAWLDPPVPEPEPAAPLAKQSDSLDKGWRLGW